MRNKSVKINQKKDFYALLQEKGISKVKILAESLWGHKVYIPLIWYAENSTRLFSSSLS